MTTLTWQGSPEGLSPDWVFSNNSDVHACNDRKWFTEFTPFSSFVESAVLTGVESPVEGVGTVNLPVKRGPNFRGPQAHHVIRLTNVLYVPTSPSNIVGMPVLDCGVANVRMGMTSNSRGGFEDHNGMPLAYFCPNERLFRLRLSGPPVGPRLAPSRLDPDVAYCLSISWLTKERERWEAHVRRGKADINKRKRSQERPDAGNVMIHGKQGETASKRRRMTADHPYTTEEKAWLRQHYGNEFKFLLSYELSIYDEEDRAEGRAIVRALMDASEEHEDGDDGNDDDEGQVEEDVDEEEEEEEEDENDFERHLADHHFDEQELRWIEEHYRDSATFMYTFGLKFYDDEDCREAKAVVRAFLSD